MFVLILAANTRTHACTHAHTHSHIHLHPAFHIHTHLSLHLSFYPSTDQPNEIKSSSPQAKQNHHPTPPHLSPTPYHPHPTPPRPHPTPTPRPSASHIEEVRVNERDERQDDRELVLAVPRGAVVHVLGALHQEDHGVGAGDHESEHNQVGQEPLGFHFPAERAMG